ncbi:MAG: DUF4136 domain-containing protein [Chitinophagaceae bacterium]|nr:DUF4136 domain-containing protein [Chitinophagaceae bacterium]
MKNRWIAGVVGIVALAFTGCQKDPLKNLTASESRIYITNRDSSLDFSSFKTFSVADSVLVIQDGQGGGKALTDYDAAMVSALKAALVKRGFQEVDRSASPDLGFNISRVYSTSTGVISYPSYWRDYGSYYDPYYWGYGGYSYYDPSYYGPSYYDVYQVTEGALTIDGLNLKDAKTGNTIRPVWSAVARGTSVFNTGNSNSEVQSFIDQSPYLVKNN